MNVQQLETILNSTHGYQKYEFYYSLFHYIAFLFSALLIGLIFLHILCRPRIRRDKEYTYLVLHLLSISFTYSIVNVMWQPILLIRTLGGYSVGLFGYLGRAGYLLGAWLSMSTFYQLSLTVTLFFSIRYFKFRSFKQPHLHSFFTWLSSPGNTLRFLNTTLFVNFLVQGPAFYKLYHHGIELPEEMGATNSKIFVAEPLTNGFYLIQLIGFFFFGLLLLEVTFCLFVYSQTRQFMKVTTALVSPKTFEMQKKFCKTFLLRLCLMILFLFIPNIILQLRTFLDLEVFQMSIVGFMSLHCPLQALLTIIEMPEWKKVAEVVTLRAEAMTVKGSGSK